MVARHDIPSHGEGIKSIQHPTVGRMTLEYTACIVESEPDLSMIVYTPALGTGTAEKITKLLARR